VTGPQGSTPFRLEYPGDPGRVIRGVIDAPTEAADGGEGRPYVLLLHGFKGFFRWGFMPELARRCVMAGLVAVRFNTSGSGIGEDLDDFTEPEAFFHATLSRDMEDIARVREEFADLSPCPVDLSRGAILGHSRGGALSLVHASERGDYRTAVAWSALSSFERYDEATLQRWRSEGFLPIQNARTGQEYRLGLGVLLDLEANSERFDILAACGRIDIPTLLVHGTEDETVVHSESQRLLASFRPGQARLLSIEAAGHTLGARHPLDGIPASLERALDVTVAHLSRHL